VPVLGFAAFSGTGKTTLLTRLIPLLRAQGLRLGVIKHAHHRFDVDVPGKDSHALREAGAERVLLGSKRRWALMVEQPRELEPTLAQLLVRMPDEDLDLVLVEGFKHERYPKIELHRPSRGLPLLAGEDPSVLAVASDEPLSLAVPCLDLNDPAAVARFVLEYARGSAVAAT
jgi:molybdopterin-guanine dinucleotide biosynthesis protein B